MEKLNLEQMRAMLERSYDKDYPLGVGIVVYQSLLELFDYLIQKEKDLLTPPPGDRK